MRGFLTIEARRSCRVARTRWAEWPCRSNARVALHGSGLKSLWRYEMNRVLPVAMKRLFLAVALIGGWAAITPAVLAAEPMPHTGRVLISTQGDISVPPGEQADLVIVVAG